MIYHYRCCSCGSSLSVLDGLLLCRHQPAFSGSLSDYIAFFVSTPNEGHLLSLSLVSVSVSVSVSLCLCVSLFL
jgi:hypothetical protein